jgi:hypothetical protein
MMLLATLRLLRKSPDELEIQEEASIAADAAAKEFVINQKRRKALEVELAEYLNRHLIPEALEIINKADQGDPSALEIMNELDSLHASFSSKKIEDVVTEMNARAMAAFQEYGKRAHRKAREAATAVVKDHAEDDKDLEEILMGKVSEVVRGAQSDYLTAVKARTALRS